MYEYNCTIRRVVDGDTVDVDIDLGFDVVLKQQRIRLYGINTPETRTRDLEEKARGLEAKDFVTNLLPVGSQCVLQSRLDSRGKFGRILGVFIVGGQSVNQMLLDEGLAEEYK